MGTLPMTGEWNEQGMVAGIQGKGTSLLTSTLLSFTLLTFTLLNFTLLTFTLLTFTSELLQPSP